jgi:GTP-binding protein Era
MPHGGDDARDATDTSSRDPGAAAPSGAHSGATADLETSPAGDAAIAHRCGVVALLGRPNAGKSTLLNALLGEKIAIISHKAQTTRSRILGVLTLPNAQLILCDTPGLHAGRSRFNLGMNEAALRAAADADVRVLLLDTRASWSEREDQVAALPPPVLLVRTQVDRDAGPTDVPPAVAPRLAATLCVSAKTGLAMDALRAAVVARLPIGPALYPPDTLTDRSLRFLAAEQIREVAFEQLRDEVPYALAVEVEEWRERDEDVTIRANVLVEKSSQKGIVVGKGGQQLKALGSEARQRIRALVDKPVHLSLWVKVDPNWTHRPKRVRDLGYH